MRLRYPGVSKQLWSSWKLRWCMKSQKKWSESFWNGLGCTTCFGNTSRACVGEELSVTWARIPGKDGLCASAQAAVPHPKFSKLTQELAICLLEIPLNAVNTGDILDFSHRITKKKPQKTSHQRSQDWQTDLNFGSTDTFLGHFIKPGRLQFQVKPELNHCKQPRAWSDLQRLYICGSWLCSSLPQVNDVSRLA